MNPFVLVGITSVFIIGIALLIHIKARRVVKGFITGDDSKLAAMLFSVNASILTLLFSITLFQVRSEFTHIRNSSGAEVSQINDVTRSILNLNVKNQKKLLPVFHDYLDFVLKNEFGFEIERETIRESNEKYDDFRTAVLKMQPANFIEKQFRTHLINLLDQMDEKRGVRLYRKEANISPVFYLLLFIFMMSLIFLSTFEKTKLSVIFVSAYSILGSVLLSFILITSSYFKGEKTGGIEFYKEALITMEEKLIEIDVLPDNEIEEMINNKLSEQEEEVN